MKHHIQKTFLMAATGLSLFLAVTTEVAAIYIDDTLNYQGRVSVEGVNFNGAGRFKFALVDAGTPVGDAATATAIVHSTYWSNDGTSTTGDEPEASVEIPVVNGLYSVRLGGTAPGMSRFDSDIFSNDLRLRVWFSDGDHGFQLLTPDQPLSPAPYALRAGNVGPGSIGTFQLANGAVTSFKMADGTVTAAKIAPGAISPLALDTGAGAPAAGQVLAFTNDGLRWVNGGLILPFTSVPLPTSVKSLFNVQATASGTSALRGVSTLADGVVGRSSSTAQNYAGVYGLNNSSGTGVYGLSESGNGIIGQTNVALKSGVLGTSTAGNGVSGTTTAAGHSGVYGSAEGATGVGGYFYNTTGDALRSVGKTSLHGLFYVHDSDFWIGSASRRGSPGRAIVDWRNPANNKSQCYINFNDDWQETVIGGAVTEVKTLRITGGADLAEPFAMSHDNVEPGSVVVIDEKNPGKLRISRDAYDKKVAGIVSGADGIRPGISMIQEDMLEAGENVALSGRVYVKANNSGGDIQPGDLLTTSAIPGEAMKASDHDRAQGAILGKSMTSLSDASGKVLVLVSLQ